MHFKTRTVKVPEGTQTFPPPPSSTTKSRTTSSKIHKARSIILPTLIVLVFTTLVLGVIYAYCVSKPHSELGNVTSEPSTNNTSAASITTAPTDDDNEEDAFLDSSYFPSYRRAEGDAGAPISSLASSETASISAQDNTNTSLAREPSSSNVEDRSALPQAPLFFYTGTVPFISLLDLSFQLFIHWHDPAVLSSQIAHRLVLLSTLLLTIGWIVTNSFWVHCEIVPSGTASRNEDLGGICPAQVRGHFMYGIHELSIAKVVIGWVVVLLYLSYAGFIFWNMRASRRVWVILGGQTSGRKEEVVFRLEDGIRAQRQKEEQWSTHGH